MRWKTLAAAILALGVALVLFLVSGSNDDGQDPATVTPDSSRVDNIDTVVDLDTSVTSTTDTAVEEQVAHNADTSLSAQSIESVVVSGTALNSGEIFQPDAYSDTFPQLVDEFRQGGAEQLQVRQKYSEFFLAQPELLNSEVSLELLECGQQICVAEFRSSDIQVLKAFTTALQDRQGYESKATLEFPSRYENVVRLVFSHDPRVNAITIPPL